MAISFDSTLTNSKGINKIVLFKGLSHPVVLTPSLLGKPILTAQPFYFSDDLDCVIRIRFENSNDMPKTKDSDEFEEFIETLIDNYLFEYAKKYPFSKVTSKVINFSYWKDNLDTPYFVSDKMNIEYLSLDTINDESIIECKDTETGMGYDDWCLMKNYREWSFENYISDLKKLLKKTVYVKVNGHRALGTGEYVLPLLKTNPNILTYHQAEMFEVVSARDFGEGNEYYEVNRGFESSDNLRIKQEVIEAKNYHNKESLAYFYSAIRDHSPLTQFRNLYNVLEYFFEDAPENICKPAKSERQMITAVFQWSIPDKDLVDFIKKLPENILKSITSDQTTTSGVTIKGINLDSPNILDETSSRVYDIRNACMHSKRTRKGQATARIVPTTKEENILKNEYLLMQWIAIKVIEKDTSDKG